jgi:glycosyltransferase involved in cell wall biosynthesis
MACGNAIVATDVGETWRLVDETTGVRVLATPAALASAINQLLADPALAERQRAARQRVLAAHAPERFLAYMIGVYQHAFQANRRHDQS